MSKNFLPVTIFYFKLLPLVYLKIQKTKKIPVTREKLNKNYTLSPRSLILLNLGRVWISQKKFLYFCYLILKIHLNKVKKLFKMRNSDKNWENGTIFNRKLIFFKVHLTALLSFKPLPMSEEKSDWGQIFSGPVLWYGLSEKNIRGRNSIFWN